MIFIIANVLLIGTMFWFLYIGLIRNNQVHSYRTKLINNIADKNLEDLDKLRVIESYTELCNALSIYDWKQRWDEYESVSYDDMVFKFWKPLDSFYKDKGYDWVD